jgi:hypothetical protein
VPDTFVVKLDGVEVARLSGDGIQFGRRSKAHGSSEMEDDPKMLKKVVNGQSLFVLMASSQKNIVVEKL